MKKFLSILFLFSTVLSFGQQNASTPQKFALVIGNAQYTNFGTLRNPVNDANDMKTALESLGFTVDIVLNGSLNQMENAVIRLKNRLTDAGNNAYGFFYYAGHGLEMNGINYLIPADANIPDRSFLRERAFSAQIMLDMLNESRNALNIVVLDACRNFPAAWSRSMSRGLAVVSNPPANHIIMYATGAGAVANDGTGRNGLFTSHLLNNLKQQEMDVNEIFRRTMGDVARASSNQQRPALYTDFADTVYFSARPAAAQTEIPQPEAALAQTPTPPRQSREPREKKEILKHPAKLNTIGISMGSGFSTPALITTIHGTYSPIRYLYLELGLDFGFIYTGGFGYERYFSTYPFANIGAYIPFPKKGGWLIGLGYGLMVTRYTLMNHSEAFLTSSLQLTTGINIIDMITIDYTVRVNKNFNFIHKSTVGYIYRF